MPITEAWGDRRSEAPGDAPFDAVSGAAFAAWDAPVAQKIDPAGAGGRTIVLTMDEPAEPLAGREASILDGALETHWIVPTRERRRFSATSAPADHEVRSSQVAPPPPAADRGMRWDAGREPDADRGVAVEAPVARRFRRTGVDSAAVDLDGTRPAGDGGQLARQPRPAPAGHREKGAGVPGRRTVQVRGTGATTVPRLLEVERRRSAPRPVERFGDRPDRIALWAFLLGLFLILVAAAS